MSRSRRSYFAQRGEAVFHLSTSEAVCDICRRVRPPISEIGGLTAFAPPWSSSGSRRINRLRRPTLAHVHFGVQMGSRHTQSQCAPISPRSAIETTCKANTTRLTLRRLIYPKESVI